MADVGSTTVAAGRRGGFTEVPPARPVAPEGGFFERYKPEQGKWTRTGTFVGLLALIVWGGLFLNERLDVFAGDAWWQLLITPGIPLILVTVCGFAAWWISYCRPQSSDFMIATEGEMKKVSWSSRREVIGSTRVVIVITLLLAVMLFSVDLLFQTFFRWMGVLKV